PAVAGVGEDADREVALGNKFEKQDVTTQRPTMPRCANGSDASQVPGDADVVVRALLAELRGAHQLQGLAPKDAFTARRATVTKMESRIGQQICDAEADASGRDA